LLEFKSLLGFIFFIGVDKWIFYRYNGHYRRLDIDVLIDSTTKFGIVTRKIVGSTRKIVTFEVSILFMGKN
jgi:hypothetical protein